MGPVFSWFAARSQSTWQVFLAPISSCVHCLLYFIIFLVVGVGPSKSVKAITDSYVTGPHGQKFKDDYDSACAASKSRQSEDLRPRNEAKEEPEEDIVEQDRKAEDEQRGQWRHGVAGKEDAPTLEEEQFEEQQAIQVLEKVINAVRLALAVAASLWLMTFTATILDLIHWIGPSALPTLEMREVEMLWPNRNMRVEAMSCAGGTMFVATKFNILRFSEDSLKFEQEPCNRDGRIMDIASSCDARGRHCWPIALIRTGDGASETQITDCRTQQRTPLLQNFVPALRFALRNVGGAAGDGDLLALHNDVITQYEWGPIEHGWVPRWEHQTVRYSVRSLDILGDYFINFGSIAVPGHQVNTSILQFRKVSTGEELGAWRIPNFYAGILGGCSFSGETFRVITDEDPPRLLQLEIPGTTLLDDD